MGSDMLRPRKAKAWPMSAVAQTKRITVPQIRAHKGERPIVCLTCYHAHTARLLDQHVDLMLVGDSLGMVMHGLETTLGVTLDMMITHAKAVMRGSKREIGRASCRERV